MSNRPRHRPRGRRRLDDSEIAVAALVASAARGCTRSPNLTRRHVGGAVWRLTIAHDDDCPALDPEEAHDAG